MIFLSLLVFLSAGMRSVLVSLRPSSEALLRVRAPSNTTQHQQLRLPFRGLSGRHAKLWDQLRQRLLTLARGERHLCREGRPMIASRSLHRLAPWFAPWGVGEARRPRTPLSGFPDPSLPGGIQEQQRNHGEYTLLPNEGVS